MPRAIEHDGVVALRESLSLGKAMIFICQHCTLISERCSGFQKLRIVVSMIKRSSVE